MAPAGLRFANPHSNTKHQLPFRAGSREGADERMVGRQASRTPRRAHSHPMPRSVFLAILALATCLTSWADESPLRSAQTVLKAQGFYFGEVTGQPSEETTQSIRRFQVRNLLPVTGELDAATVRVLDALGAAYRPSPSDAEAGRAALQARSRRLAERPPSEPAATPPPTPLPNVAPAAAPPPAVQPQSTPPVTAPSPSEAPRPAVPAPASPAAEPSYAPPPLAQAQVILEGEGFYRGEIDGRRGSRTRRALVDYQVARALRPTGRLDAPTLAAMGIDAPPEADRPSQRRRHARGGLRIFGLRLGWR